MVALFQEGVSKESGSGSCQFYKVWAWKLVRVTSAGFYYEAVTDPRLKVRGYCLHLSMQGVQRIFRGHLIKESKRCTEYHH